MGLSASLLLNVEPADADSDVACYDNSSPYVILRMDSGDRLKLPPEVLLGNGLEVLLENLDVVCGRTEVLMTSVGIALQYLARTGEIDAGDWGAASPPSLSLSAFEGASLIYESEVERFYRLKTGPNWKLRVPAFCQTATNGFEYCGASCPEDRSRPGYCYESDEPIKDWAFKILDRRPQAATPEARPLTLSCDQLSRLLDDGSRRCVGRYAPRPDLFVQYRFVIQGPHDIFDFDFGAYHDRVRYYLDGIFLE